MKRFILDMVSSLFLGLGCIAFLSPIIINRWIHGSYERYLWIINGPRPYSNFGSGPYQMVNFLILPLIIGIALISIAIIIRKQLITKK